MRGFIRRIGKIDIIRRVYAEFKPFRFKRFAYSYRLAFGNKNTPSERIFVTVKSQIFGISCRFFGMFVTGSVKTCTVAA